MCGVIFDAPQHRERIKTLELRTADPNFWSNQEAAQAVLRDRKRSEDQVGADEKLASISEDIETYINLTKEETNAEQRNELLKDLDRELNSAETYVAELETRTLLSGENDHLERHHDHQARRGRDGVAGLGVHFVADVSAVGGAQEGERFGAGRDAWGRSGNQVGGDSIQRRKRVRIVNG